MSQILDLALLPVAVQEEVLFAESVDGLEVVTERGLSRRRVATATAPALSSSPARYSTSFPACRRAASSRGSARGSAGSPPPVG